jgi:hypothetical protein
MLQQNLKLLKKKTCKQELRWSKLIKLIVGNWHEGKNIRISQGLKYKSKIILKIW